MRRHTASLLIPSLFGGLLLASAPALAESLKVAVFVVAEDEAAVPAKVQLDRIFRELLEAGDGFAPVALDADAGAVVKEVARRGLLTAGNMLTEARESFDEQMYEEAVPDLIEAVNTLEEVAPFL